MNEYKVDGFRFDMMGDHDALTMEKIADEATKINKNVLILGEGWKTYVGDDGGCEYTPDAVLPAHHLRSSFIFRKDVHDKVGKHPTEFGKTGFREESDLTMRMRFKGYDLFTDTAAKAWHLRTQSGGVRYQDYSQQVGLCDEMWRRKMRRWFKKYGWRV